VILEQAADAGADVTAAIEQVRGETGEAGAAGD